LAAVEEGKGVQVLGRAQRRLGAGQDIDDHQRRRHGLTEQGTKDVVFGLEIVVQRGLADTDGPGDGAGRCACIAERGE